MFTKYILCIVAFFAITVRTQLPPGYVCVPTGTCGTSNGNNGIDIRIVTPGNPCPAGEEPCLEEESELECGTRSVTDVNDRNGYATPGAYPWQAYLVNQTGFSGSGALLDEYHVLTAAHKVFRNRNTPNEIGVYMGVYDSARLGLRYAVARIQIHPRFNPSTLVNDIAILRLSAPISLPQENVNAICLPEQGQSFVGRTCWVSGWGQTAFNVDDAPTRRQKQVRVTIVDYNTCHASMSNPSLLGTNVNTYLDPVGEICAGGQALRDACTEDGGSPLVCENDGVFQVAGLVIWGKGCGQPGVYGVYVSVPRYINWITSALENLNGK